MTDARRPHYQRFVRAVALGALATTAACSQSHGLDDAARADASADAGLDANRRDAGPADTGPRDTGVFMGIDGPVDGPLPPPDRPRTTRA